MTTCDNNADSTLSVQQTSSPSESPATRAMSFADRLKQNLPPVTAPKSPIMSIPAITRPTSVDSKDSREDGHKKVKGKKEAKQKDQKVHEGRKQDAKKSAHELVTSPPSSPVIYNDAESAMAVTSPASSTLNPSVNVWAERLSKKASPKAGPSVDQDVSTEQTETDAVDKLNDEVVNLNITDDPVNAKEQPVQEAGHSHAAAPFVPSTPAPSNSASPEHSQSKSRNSNSSSPVHRKAHHSPGSSTPGAYVSQSSSPASVDSGNHSGGNRKGARGRGGRSGQGYSPNRNSYYYKQNAAAQQQQHQSIPVMPYYTYGYPMVDMDTLKMYLLGQIEYYFSVENLCRDIFFRKQMDAEGFVPIELISNFNRVKSLTTDIGFIYEVLRNSAVLEVRDMRVRKKDDWQLFILPQTPTVEG